MRAHGSQGARNCHRSRRFVCLPTQATVGSVLLGPLLLAALTNESDVLRADPAHVEDWVRLAPPSEPEVREGRAAWAIWSRAAASSVEDADAPEPRIVAVGRTGANYTLLPLSRVVLQNYSAFLNVSLHA